MIMEILKLNYSHDNSPLSTRLSMGINTAAYGNLMRLHNCEAC